MTTPDTPPFPPPYKTITKTEQGSFATETLADGSTRDLGEVAIGHADTHSTPAPSSQRAKARPAPVKTTSFGNSKAAMYLKVPFADKDQAKAKGARWDADKKKWYAPHGVDLNAFKPWWPETLE